MNPTRITVHEWLRHLDNAIADGYDELQPIREYLDSLVSRPIPEPPDVEEIDAATFGRLSTQEDLNDLSIELIGWMLDNGFDPKKDGDVNDLLCSRANEEQRRWLRAFKARWEAADQPVILRRQAE